MPRATAPVAVRFEHHDPTASLLGVGTGTPRLSWQIPSAEPGWRPSAYEVEVTRDGAAPRVVRVDTAEQVLVPWPVEPLTSRQSAQVRVRVADNAGTWTQWSDTAVVEAGLLTPDDWTAQLIASPADDIDAPAPVLAGWFTASADVVRARLYATAHGLYTATLNGVRVGDQELAPGWTDYRRRLRYQTYDVTDLVRAGENVLEVVLGNGWYRGRLGFPGVPGQYGDRLGLLAQLEVTTADAAVHVLATDRTWTARHSNIVTDDLYDGQRTDRRRPALGDAAGPPAAVDVVQPHLDRLVAPAGPPVRVTEVRPADRIFTSPSGATLVDFGQNAVGWVRLRVRDLPPGGEVVVRHAEVLDKGELGVRPLRSAKATDSYLVAGGEEVLEPSFTFHGFRYAEISGVEGLRPDDVEHVVIGSDLRRTGWFDSSHAELNQFHDNVVWGMRGNFVDVPTDCPQRDERLGWTGDIQVFSPTALFLFDSAGFLSSWLADLAGEQGDDGAVPFVVPNVLGTRNRPTAAWGDAATIVAWNVYQRTGDADLLARQLPSMRAWVDCEAALAGPGLLWAGGFQFGDWLDPTAPPEDPFDAQADPDIIATAYFARSAQIVGLAAAVLGDGEVSERYLALAARIRAAFARAYVTPGGRVVSDAPTVYSLALQWGLLPEQSQRHVAGRMLADAVRCSSFRISTGFVGTPLITDALTTAGELDAAYRLLLQRGCPSWLYPVTMGATTIWERWDSMLADGSINPGEMTSFNHYALGAVADWLHRTVAGLAPAAPGYREILVRPRPGGGLTHAAARHLTRYGQASVAWRRADGRLQLEVEVPVGATATVHVPGESEPVRVEHGRHQWNVADPFDTAAGLPDEPTVRDVLDHLPSWTAVATAAVDSGIARDDVDAARRLRPFLDAPGADIGFALTNGGMRPGSDAFRARIGVALPRG